MIPQLDIVVSIADLTKHLDLRKKQVAFAADQAIGDLAKAAQANMMTHMASGIFTLRRDWVLKGWRVEVPQFEKATKMKQGLRRTFARRLFHLDPYMRLQETGGDKLGRHGRRLAKPGKDLRPLGPSKDPTRIKKKDWPYNALVERPGGRVFKANLKKGGVAILRRVAGTEQGKRQYQTELARRLYGKQAVARSKARRRRLKRDARIMYWLQHKGGIKPRLGLVRETRRVVRDLFNQFFDARYAEALRTAR